MVKWGRGPATRLRPTASGPALHWEILRMERLNRRQGINGCGLDHLSKVYIFVRAVRNGEQARAVGVGRDSLRSVETNFQQSGAHLETRSVSGHGADAARQGLAECGVLVACG